MLRVQRHQQVVFRMRVDWSLIRSVRPGILVILGRVSSRPLLDIMLRRDNSRQILPLRSVALATTVHSAQQAATPQVVPREPGPTKAKPPVQRALRAISATVRKIRQP